MARVKVTLQGTEIDRRASDAQAIARYLVELDADSFGDGVSNEIQDARLLCLALKAVPQIGERTDFDPVDGAPVPKGNSADPANKFSSHDLRVCRHRAYVAETNNGNKPFVDVYYASKARPTIEIGSSAVQQKTQTYLTDEGGAPTDSADPVFRKQIVLDYILKTGVLFPASTDATGAVTPAVPSSDLPMLKTPGDGTMFRFGDSLRISSWWFNDEATITDFQKMAHLYVTCTNKGPLFFPDDDQRWLCTSLPTLTNDGGWLTRVTGEFVYSPYGWDTYSFYTDPLLNAPAIIAQEVLDALYKRGTFLNSSSGLVPRPFPETPADSTQGSKGATSKGVATGTGAGRFPQQLCRPMTSLLGYISQGILGNQPDLSQVLRQAPTTPQFNDGGAGNIGGDRLA